MKVSIPALIALGVLASCLPIELSADTHTTRDVAFTEASHDVIPLESRSRRKWDNALVADLDRDGNVDLVLTEHGQAANIYWNEGGVFSKPQKLVGGDTHGVAAGDIDKDGRMDVIVYPGGGGGTKPSNPVFYTVNKDRTVEGGDEYTDFERSRGRAAKLIDADNDGSLELALSAFPLKTKIQKEEGANFLYDNTSDLEFEFASRLPHAMWMGFRMLVTDFNNDGDTDLIFYGGKDMVAAQGGEGLAFSNVSNSVLKQLRKTTFVSSLTEIDYDNDGDFDLFVTRADHPFSKRVDYDAETQTFAYYTFAAFVKDVEFYYDLKVDGDFRMTNLQMAYPNFDVFVGAGTKQLEFDVGHHGGREITLSPGDAMGWPEEVTKNGLNIGYLGEGVWRIGGKTKSATSGVVLGVIEEPVVKDEDIEPRKQLPAKLFENRDGLFVEVSKPMGISINEQTGSAVAADFNNDGWVDLFVVPHGDPTMATEQILYLNQQGESFVKVADHGIVAKELGASGASAEAFDYDQDGDLDIIYSTERGRWHLLTNNLIKRDGANYIVVNVGSSPSGKSTSNGAILTVKVGDKFYKRVVGASSAPFSHSLDDYLHIGLGSEDQIDSAVVRWSNGETQEVVIGKLNQIVSAGKLK
ncbi:MAG: CRTAC1 family protein [Opitutaceae bacterium]